MRWKIVESLSRCPCVSQVATELGVDRKTVRLWRDRYLAGGLEALRPQKKGRRGVGGRPVQIDAVSRCQVLAMACAKPSDFGVAFRPTWTVRSLLDTYRQLYPDLSPMSRSSLLRILNKAEIRPHRMRVWLHSPDPLFREKTTEICDLYLHPPAGAVVLCVDEKTSIQALGRKYAGSQPRMGCDGRIEFEYVRHGTQCLLAAFDPHTGEVYGEVCARRTADRLVEFMESLARRYPEQQVHIVWDNLNTHLEGPDKRWSAFNGRHGNRFHFHRTPIHASWVNQVEVFFGIVARRVLKYSAHTSKQQLASELLGFIDHWNAYEKHPFRWTFVGYPPVIDRQAA